MSRKVCFVANRQRRSCIVFVVAFVSVFGVFGVFVSVFGVFGVFGIFGVFVSVFVVFCAAVFVSVFVSYAAASLALGKNRATTLAGWRTISLSKSTSFSCKTMLFVFCIYCLIGCTFDNRKFATNPKRYSFENWLSKNWLTKKKMRSHNFLF